MLVFKLLFYLFPAMMWRPSRCYPVSALSAESSSVFSPTAFRLSRRLVWFPGQQCRRKKVLRWCPKSTERRSRCCSHHSHIRRACHTHCAGCVPLCVAVFLTSPPPHLLLSLQEMICPVWTALASYAASNACKTRQEGTRSPSLSSLRSSSSSRALKHARCAHTLTRSFAAVAAEGEVDMRFLYCACAISTLLNDWSAVNRSAALDFIRGSLVCVCVSSCVSPSLRPHLLTRLPSQTYEGAFGLYPGLEAHGTSLRETMHLYHWSVESDVNCLQAAPRTVLSPLCHSWQHWMTSSHLPSEQTSSDG